MLRLLSMVTLFGGCVSARGEAGPGHNPPVESAHPGATPAPSVPPTATPSDAPELTASAALITIPGMVLIPAGPFIAGPPNAEGEPVYLSLKTYYIDRLETSVAEYSECVEAGVCTAQTDCSRYCSWKKREKAGEHAINCLGWTDAQDYCHWRGKRLPTELEWEKAARGTDGRLFPWGESGEPPPGSDDQTPPERCKNPHVWTTARECHPWDTSPYGLVDTAFGVLEWVSAWPAKTLSQELIDTQEPTGISFRGGSDRLSSKHWGDLSTRHTSSADHWTNRKRISMFDRPGFRCAVDGILGS